MTSGVRLLLRRAAGRWLRERAVPVGGLAGDRRLLRRALPPATLGRVLVVGSSLAARQVWGTSVDVVGTSPHAPYVTVCSLLDSEASLPAARWDTVVVTEIDDGLADRLQVLRTACRSRARLVLLQRGGRVDLTQLVAALGGVAVVQRVHHARQRTLVLAEVSA